MAKKTTGNMIGGWAFLVGVILAVLLGLLGVSSQGWMMLLILIGIVIGLFNIADEESTPFLLSGLALIIASTFGQGAMSAVPSLNSVLYTLLVVFVPATIIVAIRNVFIIARR